MSMWTLITDSLATWTLIIGLLASVALAVHMARVRDRSPTFWFWVALLVGPLAPLALVFLGEARRSAPAS
jgi:multisubunit Na+/H+ antiporter MnhE subunit